MENKISYQEVKDICTLIIDEESKKHGLDLDINVVGKLEFFKTDFFKKNFKLHKDFFNRKFLVMTPFLCSGVFYPPTSQLFVFLSNNKLIKAKDLTYIILVLYHEIYHAVQNSNHNKNEQSYDWSNYYNFISELEKFAHANILSESKRYNDKHDSFLFEILADMYAIIHTRDFMKKNNYKIDEKLLEDNDNNNLFHYECYISSNLIDAIIDDYELIKDDEEFKSKGFDIFLDDKGNPKRLEVIFSDKRIKNVDKQIIKAFLISRNFFISYDKYKLNKELTNLIKGFINEEIDVSIKGR